jgi:hypothetical protein
VDPEHRQVEEPMWRHADDMIRILPNDPKISKSRYHFFPGPIVRTLRTLRTFSVHPF